jgi:hypothetical protein
MIPIFKRRSIISCAALLMLSACTTTAPQVDLAQAGWTYVTASQDAQLFMKPDAERGPPEARRVWTAYELETARDRQGFEFRSVQSLGEYDCTRRRTRVIDETFHAAPGLTGKTWKQPDFTPTDWAEAAPESVGEIRMDFACQR